MIGNVIDKLLVATVVLFTDKLKSYRAAITEMGLGVEHRQYKEMNSQAENSHQWTRLRENKRQKFKLVKQAQRFLSAGALIYQQTQPPRHKLLAAMTEAIMAEGIRTWKEITAISLSSQA